MEKDKNSFNYKKEKLETIFGKSISEDVAIQLLDFVKQCPEFIAFYMKHCVGESISDAIDKYLKFIRKNKQIFYRRTYQENKFNFNSILLYLLLGFSFKKAMQKVTEFYDFLNDDEHSNIDDAMSFIYNYKENEHFRLAAKTSGFIPPKAVKQKPNNE